MHFLFCLFKVHYYSVYKVLIREHLRRRYDVNSLNVKLGQLIWLFIIILQLSVHWKNKWQWHWSMLVNVTPQPCQYWHQNGSLSVYVDLFQHVINIHQPEKCHNITLCWHYIKIEDTLGFCISAMAYSNKLYFKWYIYVRCHEHIPAREES